MKIAPLLRTGIAQALVLTAAAAVPAAGWAQEYPTRPIRFIVGFVPGGIADLMARSLGQKLAETWGQQVITDNRAGGGGVISMQIVEKATPDGYTLLLGSSTQFSITPSLRPHLPYDVIRDYTPVTPAALTPVILTVQPAFPARSVPELVALAKTKAMNYASTGYGAAPHIAAELLKRTAGIDLLHVPFKGGGDAVIALMGGHVPMSFGAVSTSLPHIKAGRMRALGVTSAKRLAATPDVPSFAEQGLTGFEVVQWFGVFGPAKLPPAITKKLNAALAQMLTSAPAKEQFAVQGVELQSATPEAFAAYVKTELARWSKMLKELDIRDQP